MSTPAPRPLPPVPQQRPDASMDLLNTLRREALDPSYAAVTGGRGVGRNRPWVVVPALLLVGLILGMALAQTLRTAPAAERERQEVVQRIAAGEERLDQLRAEQAGLAQEVRTLRSASGLLPAADAELLTLLGARSGADAVTGDGVRVTVDDGADAQVRGSRVVDADLRMVVNGLWASGAEAVAVNGHRLSSRTAIRNAGEAITVDYRSVTRPYVVEAIGDPRGMESSFRGTEGGRWVEGLRQHFGVEWSLQRADRLTLPGDPGLDTRNAQTGR